MLKSLEIKNFRSLTNFKVDRLGRVNLMVGRNNSGKSTVLEALRIYAANGQREVLDQIAAGHDEKFRVRESESDGRLPYEDFFSGRQYPERDDGYISIGEIGAGDTALVIQHILTVEEEEIIASEDGVTTERIRRRTVPKNQTNFDFAGSSVSQAILVSRSGRSFTIPLDSLSSRFKQAIESPPPTPVSNVPTQFISADELALEWDKLVFSEYAQSVKRALRIIAPDFEDIAFVQIDLATYRTSYERSIAARGGERRRAAMIKVSNVTRALPLNSLGDGMLRVLQLALKIFPSKGGFLLIDEFENGLHFSVQEKVWMLLFELAQKLDIQIFATTHSWDCIESFAKAAKAMPEAQGLLFRIGRSVRASDSGQVIATLFDKDDLQNVTQADVEVR